MVASDICWLILNVTSFTQQVFSKQIFMAKILGAQDRTDQSIFFILRNTLKVGDKSDDLCK